MWGLFFKKQKLFMRDRGKMFFWRAYGSGFPHGEINDQMVSSCQGGQAHKCIFQ